MDRNSLAPAGSGGDIQELSNGGTIPVPFTITPEKAKTPSLTDRMLIPYTLPASRRLSWDGGPSRTIVRCLAADARDTFPVGDGFIRGFPLFRPCIRAET